ncbi:alkylation response protein AidB-like acyl-CoA dehydrogenase [Streptosporangium saharense]|uniref:Alkylation response protein AidB-like acyl-CoA dehydrogenase n=1 Tax=Streptosporangium saharense TaxID=1706840 RepID=A0A7W7QIW1_9ACTN|nr:alkylation response protein AidB-like acyl-CoA dehydrogenase [Streptosporangium saharense]
MSEPDVASSDATNLTTSITRDGDDYVVNGRKWFVSGAADPRCRVVIVLGNTDPEAPAHRRRSTVLVPMDTPLAAMYAHARAMRLLGGPDEVHLRAVARRELKPYLS